jgi:hypothetical protein
MVGKQARRKKKERKRDRRRGERESRRGKGAGKPSLYSEFQEDSNAKEGEKK